VSNLPYAGVLCVIALVLAGVIPAPRTATAPLALAGQSGPSPASAGQVQPPGPAPACWRIRPYLKTLLVLAQSLQALGRMAMAQTRMLVTRNGRLVQNGRHTG